MSKYTYRKRMVKLNVENARAKNIQKHSDVPAACREFIFKYITRGGKVVVFPDQWAGFDKSYASMPEGIGPDDAVKLNPPEGNVDQ